MKINNFCGFRGYKCFGSLIFWSRCWYGSDAWRVRSMPGSVLCSGHMIQIQIHSMSWFPRDFFSLPPCVILKKKYLIPTMLKNVIVRVSKKHEIFIQAQCGGAVIYIYVYHYIKIYIYLRSRLRFTYGRFKWKKINLLKINKYFWQKKQYKCLELMNTKVQQE